MKMYPGSTWESHQVNAVWNPLKDTGTNMPYVSFADKELGASPLYYNSLTAAALLIDKTVMPNFGHLPTGIIMGIIDKGDYLGYIFPADFAVTAESASGTAIVVSEADAVFFKKGMTITAGDVVAKIVSIEVAGGKATITVDAEVSSTVISYPFKRCVVIDQPVFSDQNGALTSAIYSNATVYAAKLLNASEELLEKLGAFVDGHVAVIK